MTARRQYAEPPRWSREEITRECALAIEAFVERRLGEGAGPYREAFATRLATLEQLHTATDELRDLTAVTRERGWARTYGDSLRYLAGPVVSADDLKTIARSQRFTEIPAAERKVHMVREALDLLRFPWVAEGRDPDPEERDRALRWTLVGLYLTRK